MKYKELYDYGFKQLTQAKVPDAGLDARLLLEWICKTARHDLLAHSDKEISREMGEAYFSCITRRGSREPLQHITGIQEFMGLDFMVGREVLIPRQDTEVLVEEVMRHLHDGMDILDMCTGSGCILLSLLHYSNGCKGTGADVSGAALDMARRNAADLGEEDAVFVQSDLFEQVDGKFDIIVSNPPYIRAGEIAKLMEEVREHEPREALDGGSDGLYFYNEIIAKAGQFLRSGGYLFLEIGFDQADAVKERMKREGCREISVVKDFAGLDRVVFGHYVDK